MNKTPPWPPSSRERPSLTQRLMEKAGPFSCDVYFSGRKADALIVRTAESIFSLLDRRGGGGSVAE